MHGLSLKTLIALLLLVDVGFAGLVHRRGGKETLSPSGAVDQDNQISLSPQRIDQIPVTIIHEPEQKLTITASAPEPQLEIKPEAEAEPEPSLIKTPIDPNTAAPETPEDSAQKAEKIAQPTLNDVIPGNIITEHAEPQLPTEAANLNLAQKQSESEPTRIVGSLSESQQNEEQSISDVPLEGGNSIKALGVPENVVVEQHTPEVVVPEVGSPEVVVPLEDDLQRQATQATPTQTSTQQNFVQQFIQNTPIGQFLSQFTGGQQQQQSQPQPGQVQADEPATPAPTLPGFLNPAAAITSAQQAVQNAAQSVVNSTTQAFQGLQQFATNLGTQFQNTFSTLAGQQNQLSTADSTTTRPPGPIQSIVSSLVNPGNNNQATEGGATPGAGQQQQGPLQGILSFFQGGNRPPAGANVASTAAPPKEEPITPSGVADKIETEQHDAIPSDQQEPDAANEVRNSAEVTNEDTSLEEEHGEDLIVVNDDVNQPDITV